MKNIAVIGSSNVDMIMKLPHLPAVGETVTDGDFMQTFGGKGANQAVAAAKAGGKVTFVTCLGNDVYADILTRNFAEMGMDTRYVFTETDINTGMALIMFDGQGDNYLSVSPGSNYRLTPERLQPAIEMIAHADMLVLQLEIPLETNELVFELATRYQRKVMFNLAPARAFKPEWLRHVTYFVVNEIEAEMVSGLPVNTDEEIVASAHRIREYGCKTVIITLGKRGSYVLSNSFSGFVAAFAINAVDTTAAGDTFCGALAVALTEDLDMPTAIRFASAASAISVTRMGAQPSIPTRSEIDAFLKAN